MAISISRRFLRRSAAFQAEEREGDENKEWNKENTAALITDKQSRHTSHITRLVYARGIMEMAGVVAKKRQQFRMLSTD
jgi:hypothetical protein